MTKTEIKNKIEEYEKLWSRCSCDCLHYGLLDLEQKLANATKG
jgi:hypothetical protein